MTLEGKGIIATFPDGKIESGVIVEKLGRLCMDDMEGSVHAIDGGFPDGTKFDVYDMAEEEEIAEKELEGVGESE